MKINQVNHGFIKPVEKPEDYIFLGVSKSPYIVLQENGQWTDLPKNEEQAKRGFDSNSCTSFGSLNLLEILIKKIFGREENFSERFSAIVGGQERNGADPFKILDGIRKSGVVVEDALPFDENIETWEQYFQPNPMTDNLIALGSEFVRKYQLNYERLKPATPETMMEALKYSPLGCAVFAWAQNEEGLYHRPQGLPDTHWTIIIGYVRNKYWVCFDSYMDGDGDMIKHLDWNFGFEWVARLSLVKKIEEPIKHKNWFIEIILNLLRLFKW